MRSVTGISEYRHSLRTREHFIAKTRIHKFTELIEAVSEHDSLKVKSIISQLRSKSSEDYSKYFQRIIIELKNGLATSKQRFSTGPFIESLQMIVRGKTGLEQFSNLHTALQIANEQRIEDQFMQSCLEIFETITSNAEVTGLESIENDLKKAEIWFLDEWGQLYLELYDKNLINESIIISSRINSKNRSQKLTLDINHQAPINTTSNKSLKTITEAWNVFLDKRRKGGNKETTVTIYKSASKFVCGILGENLKCSELSVDHIDRLEEYLLMMPGRAFNESGTKKYFKEIYEQGGSLSQVIDFYNENKRKTKFAADGKEWPKLLSEGKLKQYINNIDKFLLWGYKKGYFHRDFSKSIEPGNKNARKSKSDSKVREFKPTELQIIFNSYLFDDTLAKSEQPKPINFWMILFGLFTGMRIEEIVALRMENIIEEDGLLIIEIIESWETKNSVKVPSSIRKIPLPDVLIKAGFFEFYKEREKFYKLNPASTLFFNFRTQNEIPDKFSDNVSKTFGRFRDELGLPKHELRFHSFRNTFISFFLECDHLTDRKLMQIVGHSVRGQTHKYQKEFEQSSLKEVIESVHFDIPLDRVHWNRYKAKTKLNWQYSKRSK